MVLRSMGMARVWKLTSAWVLRFSKAERSACAVVPSKVVMAAAMTSVMWASLLPHLAKLYL